MRRMKAAKKHLKRMLKDKRGIDTILAALLMVVIVVVASVMVYAWSTGLLGALMVTPQVGKEALNIENFGFVTSGSSANMNVTLYLRNTGTASISLATYYVKDTAGNQYSRLNWGSGPNPPTTIAPNALGSEMVLINTSCGVPTNCTLSGTAFTFSAGSSYTVTIITSRNNQFTFTVIR